MILYGNIQLESFNIGCTLKWGKKVPIPKCIKRCEMKPRSMTTEIFYIDKDWSVLIRLHSPHELVELSSEFDVRLMACPQHYQAMKSPTVMG